ncbi:N-acetylmuramoyl-L-alanine amidase [Desulfosporosinus sp. PR]|uniref:N-acetylmuramoyl-L-alanine amidase n=1 Tax=Candidatus Desulfosporosinus nitrosoreducens TaxID=3401928 RepID=UPI0027E739ED|nr:N-acetylmuramoyl-L-alanine amidase [Desulfosporosinus sp. PR]MDQ7092370.1 N-acetylmuramoyl-L-alanine amidase [Desulfosporosinus sp. PR]
MNHVKKIIIAMITSLTVILFTPLLTQASPLAYSTERIAGQDCVETALKISQKGWDSAQTVILCQSSDYPDSIAATPYAVSLDAPILLTGGETLDSRVVQELQRLKPQKVILLGGTACLQPSLEKGLEQLSLNWERIGGIDRYETSVLLAKRLTSDSLIVANGDNFPDALSAATYAGIKQIPIVLTSTTLPDSVLKYLNATQPKHITVVGGEVVVPSQELTANNFTIETRLAGQDRYDTNANVVSQMKDIYQSKDLYLASGVTFPDAVAGTVLASKAKAPLLLTEQKDIPPSIYSFMRLHMIVEPALKTSANTGNAAGQKGTVSASGGLNLRDTPASTGKVLVTIPKGASIDLLTLQNNWYKTTYQGKTGWVSGDYVTPASSGSNNASSSDNTSANVDLSLNGSVYILGGTGVISAGSQAIIQGQASSTYASNLKDFPPLPSSIQNPTSPDPDGSSSTPDNSTPVNSNYDPSKEVLVDPFEGIPANALAGKTIMLDPGHGGPDTGAIGPNHTYEKNNTLPIAQDLSTILQQAGAKVLLTRSDDSSPAANYSEVEDLQARVDEAAKSKPDLFISIHNDSFSNPAVQGTTTYYCQENPQEQKSQQLASSIQNAVIDTVKTNNRGAKEANFYVIRYTSMPAVLLEAAFISSPYEEARLQNDTFRKNVAAAIFHGIYNYYNTPLPND